MPKKKGDANVPQIKKVTKKQWAEAAKGKPPKGRKVSKGGIIRWLLS